MLTACNTVYYNIQETFGREKRDILKSNVTSARAEQMEAQEEFQSALEALTELTDFDGGELEKLYNRLDRSYQRCQSKADDISDRIGAIEKVAGDLFKEWEREADTISNRDLKRQSLNQLEDTRDRYRTMVRSMVEAREKMDPVLLSLHDHVLFLKHNLNAQAIGSLQGEVVKIDREVKELIVEMQEAIQEAERFIQGME
jgi:hypothetical protein